MPTIASAGRTGMDSRVSMVPRRPGLDPLEIRRIVAQPEARAVQADGRIRPYGDSQALGCFPRVVLLSDGETAHNAFPDESYPP